MAETKVVMGMTLEKRSCSNKGCTRTFWVMPKFKGTECAKFCEAKSWSGIDFKWGSDFNQSGEGQKRGPGRPKKNP